MKLETVKTRIKLNIHEIFETTSDQNCVKDRILSNELLVK